MHARAEEHLASGSQNNQVRPLTSDETQKEKWVMVKEERNYLFQWGQQWKIADEDLKGCLHSAKTISRFI